MTLAEKAIMMSGKNTWETVDFENMGFRLWQCPMDLTAEKTGRSRRPFGIECQSSGDVFSDSSRSGKQLGRSTWRRIGEALAEEAVTMGVNVILGPGLNIKRSPLCGRNFEYFSEDPYHAGKMAAAYVRGIQSKGIAACPKHLQQTVRSCAVWRTILS